MTPENKIALRPVKPQRLEEGGGIRQPVRCQKEGMKKDQEKRPPADALMDLSTGGPIDEIRRAVINETNACIGSVPLYQVWLKS